MKNLAEKNIAGTSYKEDSTMPTPQKPIEQDSELSSLLRDLNSKVGRLEKALSYNRSVFRELDAVANRLNPDYFHKNQDHFVTNDNSKQTGEPKPVPAVSGVLQDFYNQINYLADIIRDLEINTETEYEATVRFFKANI